jgi:hypothetical protein
MPKIWKRGSNTSIRATAWQGITARQRASNVFHSPKVASVVPWRLLPPPATESSECKYRMYMRVVSHAFLEVFLLTELLRNGYDARQIAIRIK